MLFVKPHTLIVLVLSLVLTSCAPTPKPPGSFPAPTSTLASPQPTSLSWKDATVIEFTPRESKGLKLIPSQGDGKYKVIRENGNEAIQTSGMLHGNGITNYLYFDVSDDFYHGGTRPITITIEYLDEGYGAVVLEYDSNAIQRDAQGLPAYRAVYPIIRNDSKEWKEATYTIADAFFGNRQNFGADFRLSSYNTPLTIRKVVVTRDVPVVITPTLSAITNSPAGY